MYRSLTFVGVAGFEPTTSSTPMLARYRATLHPEEGHKCNAIAQKVKFRLERTKLYLIYLPVRPCP